MQQINRIPSLNGTSGSALKAKPSKAPRKPAKAPAPIQAPPILQQPSKGNRMPSTAKQRAYITAAMGVWIPLLSLGLSHTGGKLLQAGGAPCILLGLFAFSLMAVVLTVSLSHLAWAVEDITHSPAWASWAMAVAFDLLLVLCELTHVAGKDADVEWIVGGMMVVTCGFSMALNCWAFFHGKTHGNKNKQNN